MVMVFFGVAYLLHCKDNTFLQTSQAFTRFVKSFLLNFFRKERYYFTRYGEDCEE